MALALLCGGWLLGLYAGQMAGAGVSSEAVLRGTEGWLAALLLVGALAAALGWPDRRLRLTALTLVVALLAVWRSFALLPQPDSLADRTGAATVCGVVSARPETRDTSLVLTVDVDGLQGAGGWQDARARVLVRTDRYGDWAYGDRVTASGELRPVERSLGYWADHLARRGIYTTMEYPSLQPLGKSAGLDLLGAVDRLRDRLDGVVASLLPEPQASLLSGILVGSRGTMPAGFRDALNLTSTSHLVAVSGFNVTVVAGAAQLLSLRFVARRRATLFALALVWAYTLMTGFPPSALRAAIMASMMLVAGLAGRGGDALSFLLLSAALMAGFDPRVIYDLGFQLSFLATAGLVMLEPVLRRGLAWLPAWLAGSLSVTLAAQLPTLPVLAGSFNMLSLVSPLTNLLVAPVLPGLMATGALAAGAGGFHHPLGQVVAPLAWLYLTYMVEVIRATAWLPGAAVSIGSVGAGLTAAYYAALVAPSVWPLPEVRDARERLLAIAGRVPRWLLAGAAAALLSAGVVFAAERPDGAVHVYFLDVGGDATLIKGPDGHTVLVDGGPSPSALTSALGRRVGLIDRGLDAVVLTGFEEDRLAGMIEVARRHPVGLVWRPRLPEVRRGALRAWQMVDVEKGLPDVEALAGQKIALGGSASLEVVYSGEGARKESPALAMKLTAWGTTVLLPGDLPRGVQASSPGLRGRVDVLRVPGQGAAGTLDERFVQAASPRAAVVPVRAGNREGNPDNATLDLLRRAAVYRTDRDGTVEVVIRESGFEVYTDR